MYIYVAWTGRKVAAWYFKVCVDLAVQAKWLNVRNINLPDI